MNPRKRNIPLFLLICCLFIGFNIETFSQSSKTITLVIDPGHGGKDPGKSASSSKFKSEKDIVLAIALKLGNYINTKVSGVKVVYTRKTDKWVSLDQIVGIANNNKADYFISIHCNSNPNKYVSGTKTHIHSHSFKKSKNLALQIEKEFQSRGGRKSRGVFSAKDRGQNLQILQYTEMPGVLIETGFLSNPSEERYLNSDYGQSIIASAIYRAFRDFLATTKAKYIKENRASVYKVQILSSIKPLTGDYLKFRRLGSRVERHSNPKKGKYKYRYLVGREYEKQLAEKLAKKIRKKGFKDAFVIKFK